MDDASPIREDEEQEEEGARYVYFRGRPLRTTGKSRSRYEGYEDRIQIDHSKPLGENIREALAGCLNTADEGPANKIRISHLNNLARLAEKYARERQQCRSGIQTVTSSGSSLTFEQVLLCLRYLLTDGEREIRAAVLRVLRYLVQSDEDMIIALRLHLDILIARCLDMVLDNRIERNQCMRLLISLVDRCPSTFPASLVKCLLAISVDGQAERDKVARAATAALCELVVQNPDLVLTCGGLSWLVRSVLMSGQSSARLAECLTTVLAAIYNQRRHRQRYEALLRNVFYDLLAPLMDEHFRLSGLETEEKTAQITAETDLVLENCKAAIVAALRTWPGLIGCFSYSSGCGYNGTFLPSPIYALVASLCLESAKIKDFAIDAICEVMNLPYQSERIDSWEKALEVPDGFPMEDYKYSLTQQFANADAVNVLYDWNKWRRPCLTTQTKAFLLLGLVDAGLINALVRVVVTNPNGQLELKMTLLLSDILDMCGRWLPSIYRQLSLCLSSLLNLIYNDPNGQEENDPVTANAAASLASPPSEVQRQNAIVLSYRLRIMSSQRQQPKRIRTLQMENLIAKFGYATRDGTSDRTLPTADNQEKTTARIQTLKSQSAVSRSASVPADGRPVPAKLAAERVHELIRDSRTTVPYSNHTAWDWSLIYLALCQMNEHRHHLDDNTCPKFTSQLIQFFDPAGGHFCKLTDDYVSYSRVGCILMRVLGSAAWDSAIGAQLKTFLAHLLANLLPDRLHVGLLSTKNILNNSSADYFIFIGQLNDTESGRLVLEKTGITQRLLDLISNDSNDAYIKLVISSMVDYDRPGIGRVLLQKALTITKEGGRVYATRFLATLGKLKVAQFADWGMELLINQLRDGCRAVVEEAVCVIEELINDEEYLESLVRLRPSLLPLGDAGVLLLTHVMGSEQTVAAMMRQSKRYPVGKEEASGRSISPQRVDHFVGKEIERWKSTFNTRYACIVDERLCESLSAYRRMADGRFPTHASTNLPMGEVYVPPHLYGQLARHAVGCELLQAYGCIESQLDVLHNGPLVTDKDILNMKAAIWALGHVSSTELGYKLLPATIGASFVKMAEECPVLSLRGCAFYVLNLIAQSCSLARERLRHLAWDATPRFPSIPTFRNPDKRDSVPAHLRDYSHTASVDGRDSDTLTGPVEGDPGPSSLLSASVASGGEVFSSASGSSPPRAPSPSVGLLLNSPAASRKSSQARPYIRSYHSHYSSSDARSILTCASCELCRWTSPGGFAPNGADASARTVCTCNFANIASPIKILCCEPSPSSFDGDIEAQGFRQPNDAEQHLSARGSSADVSSPTATSPIASNVNLLPALAKRQSTPSPKRCSPEMETRKISVPAKLESIDHNKEHRPRSRTASEGLPDHLTGGFSKGALDTSPSPNWSRLVGDKVHGFFARIEKRPDAVSEFMRSAFGLRKAPLLPEDLPSVVRRSFWRMWETRPELAAEYITDDNATGFAAWRLLQSQQRERSASLDTTPKNVFGRAAAGLGRAAPLDESLGVEEERVNETAPDVSIHSDRSPTFQRLKLRPFNNDDSADMNSLGSEKPMFMCLPLDIGLVCNVIDWPSKTQSALSTVSTTHQSVSAHYPAINHVIDFCLHCRPLTSKDTVLAARTTSSRCSSSRALGETGPAQVMDQLQQTAQSPFRKELLRLVSLLSVRKKYAEQGLLRLKQEAPQLFRSLCVYCDVSYVMSVFTFRLSARRFLQELFQDVDFAELWIEPKRAVLTDRQHHRLPSAPAPLS